MAAKLPGFLRELHQCLDGGTSQDSAVNAHDIIGDIGHCCLQDVTDKEIDYCLSVLFDKEHGVVVFLKKTVTLDEFQSAKSELLQILQSLVDQWGQRILPYAIDIKDACMSLFTRDKYSKVKNQAIPLLISIVSVTSTSKMAEELKVQAIIEKFFMELTKASKHSATVKQNIFHLLGALAEVYPEHMINYSERLLDLYVKTLKTEMGTKTRKPEFSIISGCLQGLRHLLMTFTQSADEGAKHAYDIYKFTRMAMDPSIKHTRFEMPKAALELMAVHAAQFNQYLLDEYEKMYDILSFWSSHRNRDALHSGMRAMQAFLGQVAQMLVTRANAGEKGGGAFRFFICKFRSIMDNPDASNKEVSLAVEGYGFFAAPCKIFLEADDVKFMLNDMIQRCEQIYLSPSDIMDDKMISLPSFLQALASIVREIDEASETFVLILERLLVLEIENYPKISEKMHTAIFIAILKVLTAMSTKGAVFKGFLNRIIFQAVIRTCSRKVVLATEDSPDDAGTEAGEADEEGKRLTYLDYLGLWRFLLEPTKIAHIEGVTMAERQALSRAVYDELINAVIALIQRLDLTSARTDLLELLPVLEAEAGASSSDAADDSLMVATADPVQGLQANRPKDFIIFINLVDFSRDILQKHRTELFLPWVFTFGHEIILHSTKYPLVSGFYKLFAVCMKITSSIGYFKEINVPSKVTSLSSSGSMSFKDEVIDVDELMEVEIKPCGDLVQKEASYVLFSKFTEEVLTRMKQYKEELLAACLTLILSLPKEIVIPQFPNIVPALQISLKLGQSYLVLANSGLDAIDYWSQVLPSSVIDPYYKDILPCLDAYLRTSVDVDGNESTLTMTTTKAGKKSGRRKLPVKLLNVAKREKNKKFQSQLGRVKQRCVHLLGVLGGSTNNTLIASDPEELAKAAIAWDTELHLKYQVPFIDIKPVIYFDIFLPRTVELATTSTERQTKIAACELLHSFVLYALGRTTSQRGSLAEKEPMEALFRKLFPVILQLACDVDQVTRDLFEPLMMQLIHWFTSNKAYESPDTIALLQSLMDGVVSPTDTAVRDYSARCINEFLKWSIKHVSKKNMEKSALNVKSLLKRLFSLARHPSSFKRLGAALAFNNIYTIFREEEALVNKFTFQVLTAYIDSLALAHEDDKSLGTVEQCKQVLNHLERIIKVKADMLSKNSDSRTKVRGWAETNLIVCMKWLMRQCGRPQTECRHACMQLVYNLAPSVKGIKTTKDFFTNFLKELGAKYFIQRFETAMYQVQKGKSGLAKYPTIQSTSSLFNPRQSLVWFDLVLASLDCYNWVFSQNLLSPDQVFIVSDKAGTSVFVVLNHFIADISQADLCAVSKLFDVKLEETIFSPKEIDDFNRAKCTVIVRIMMFIITMLYGHKKGSLKVIPGSFWSDSLWDMIATCAIAPSKLGFNMGDVEIMMNLPQEVQKLLQVTNGSLPNNILQDFKNVLRKKLARDSEFDLFGMLPLDLSKEDHKYLELSHLVEGYKTLHKAGLLVPSLAHKASAEKLAENLVDCVFQSVATETAGKVSMSVLSPTSIGLGKKMLDLAFSMGIKPVKLLGFLLDKTTISHVCSDNHTQQGALFYATYRDTLNTNLVSVAEEVVSELAVVASREWLVVGTVFSGMLEHVSRDKILRKKEGPKIVGLISKHWRDLASWWASGAASDKKAQALIVLTKAVVVDAKIARDVKQPGFKDVFNMYCGLMTDKSTSLGFKSRALDILPFFASLTGNEISELKDTLNQFVADQFPLKSNEFVQGSPKYNDYITALNKILSALELSGSLTLLELLLSIMCREDRHVHEDSIQESLARFVSRLAMDKQKPAVDVAYGIFTNEEGFPNAIRRAALERVCVPMLRLVKIPALTEFFLDHIKAVMTSLNDKFKKNSLDDFESQLITKLCNMQLLEVMYSRLPKNEVSTKDSRITNVYCGGKVEKGNELTTAIIKACSGAKSEDMRGETDLLDLRRQYHCAAYNTLISAVSCTQTEEKFYDAFLFSENHAKGQFLFENLLDLDRKYTFAVELEKRAERMKKFVSIRKEVQEGQTVGGPDEDHLSPGRSRSVHYLASYLADSSISSDVSQFDFTSSVGGTYSMVGGSSGSYRPTKKSVDLERELESTVMVKDDYVEMEMDELNQHECMATMMALLQHMVRNNLSSVPEKGTQVSSMPKWMTFLHGKMTNGNTKNNIRLFLAKLIINAQEVFRPYAKFWLAPLVQLIVSGQTGSPGIHSLVVDLVVTVLSWHTVAIPQDDAVDKVMASRLLQFLISNCYHESRQVLRNNLQVLKTLVEVWRARIEVPYGLVYEKFHQGTVKSLDASTGIQVLGVIVANKMPPFAASSGVEKERYFQHLAMNMSNENKSVYAPASEVVGMALQYLSEKEKQDEEVKWRDMYVDNIMKMLKGISANSTAKGKERFITSVHKMQTHYPAAAEKFVSQMLFILPSVHGEYKTMTLEIIQEAIGKLDNAFVEMKNKGINNLLDHRDESTQQVALKVVLNMLEQLKPDELLYVLPSVANFTSNPSATCRNTMYDIFMWIYDHYREEDSESGNKILTITKDCLLKGLSDEDLKNKLNIQNFWSHETRLPVDTVDRLVAMLEAMYSPATESHYLSYATNLILEMTSKSPDFNAVVFEYPLSECKFEEYNVKSSWRQRHAAMTPLFVETQASQSQVSSSFDGDDSMAGQVRATQDVANFTPTQNLDGGGGKGPFNWLTQSSFDTYSEVTLPSFATESQSALLFNVGKSPKDFKTPGPNFGKSRLKPVASKDGAKSSSDQQSDIMRLKRRFIRSSEEKSLYYMKQQIRLRKMREDIIKEQREKRENQVTMYRKYRMGDLPDIQIKNSYIIAPLQALAQRDNKVARLLFSSVFRAIFAEIENVKTEREAQETVENINRSLNNMLSNSQNYIPAFISSMLDIAYWFPRQLRLDPAAVSTACLTSLQQPIGVLMLEERLLETEGDEERPSKKARVSRNVVSQETSIWIELARLYKSLGQFDVLQGIFSSKIGTQDLTMQALEAEMRGDYQEAVRKYTEGLSTNDWNGEEPSEVELDLWDDSRLECYKRLTQWDNLRKFTEEAIDDHKPPRLDRVWTDTYYQEHYLNPLVTSKIKCLLEGDEQQELLNFIDSSMNDPDRKAILESRYCEELALLYLWQEDYDRANFYSGRAIEAFLQEWGGLDSLMVNSRNDVLQSVQKLVELKEFLNFIRKEENHSSTVAATKLVNRWLYRKPSAIKDPTTIWDDVITNRCVYMEKMCEKLEANEVTMEVDGQGLFDERKVILRLMQADSARQQDNFSVALKLIRDTRSDAKKLNGKVELQWSHTYSKIHHRRCQVLPIEVMSVEERLKTLAGTVTHLDSHKKKSALTADVQLSSEHSILRGRTFELLVTLILKNDLDIGDLPAEVKDKVESVAESTGDHKSVLTALLENGYTDIKAGMSMTESASDDENQKANRIAHLALFKYCDDFLRRHEDEGVDLSCKALDEFPEQMVTSLLTAMKDGSSEARGLFPRLLQLAETFPAVRTIFVRKSKDVASWMFLDWLGQMTALLDKNESVVVQDILIRVATDYPQALIYPFKLSYEGYNFDSSASGKKGKEVSTKLAELLNKNKLVDCFINALEQFGQPNALFKDWYEACGNLLKASKRDKEKIKKEWKELLQDLMDPSSESEQDLYDESQEGTSLVFEKKVKGQYRMDFAKAFCKNLFSVCGKNGEKLNTMSYKDFMEKCVSLRKEMDNATAAGKMKPPGTLKEYSMWLNNFQVQDYEMELELPGQYTGKRKPLPEYHVKISCFDERVKVMASIRKPKCIIIRGNDAKDYRYLVKGGEDLRQDQRIEQLFAIMNDVFKKDAACSQRQFNLRTYQVIPMTTRVGMIEWMDQTIPLKEKIDETMTHEEKKAFTRDGGPNNPVHQQNDFMGGSDRDAYFNNYNKVSRSATEKSFKVRERMVRWNLLREAYKKMSTSLEAYFTIRSNFAVSHAVLCVSHYVLGIGDRHLSNVMIDLKTGCSVGIDFGHAFGSATQILPVPELMPFRLTKQLRNLLLPLQEKGLLEGSMIHALRALRNNSDQLLATMDVFIKEPSLDWVQFAEKQQRQAQMLRLEEAGEPMKWYPKQKVMFARRKLMGDNPAYLMSDELKMNPSLKGAVLNSITKVAMGDRALDIRAKLPMKGLSVEQQVACLLNHATDTNILGRTWVGWAPFV